MEATFKKNLEKSYMILDSTEENIKDYRVRILTENKIPGLCNMSVQQFNNDVTLRYDITGLESISHRYISTKMKSKDIKTLMFGLNKIMDSAKEYMLDINKIVLDPDFVFLDANNKETHFCYYPDKEEELFWSVRELLNRLIQMADHNDKETIIVSYGLQQLGTKQNITMNEIMEFIRSNTNLEENSDYTVENMEVGLQELTEQKKPQKELNKDIFDVKENEKNKSESKNSKFFERVKEFFNRLKPQYLSEADIFAEPEIYDVPSDNTMVLVSKLSPIGVMLKAKDIDMAQTIIPREFPCVIGKSKKSADCVIEDKTISRVHLRINEESDGYYIEDLNSTNGTYLNGERVRPHIPQKINVGDSIQLSNIEYIVC